MSVTDNSWIEEQSGSAGPNGNVKSLSVAAKKERLKNTAVRDSWEDEDDEDDDPIVAEENNKRIWDEANIRESRPMPVIVARGSSILAASSSLPLNEPQAMRILKRPPSNNIPTSKSTTTGESVQDREARYLLARERIFGTSTVEDDTMGDSKLKHPLSLLSTNSNSSHIIRELRGPPLDDGINSSGIKGFVDRRPEQFKDTVESPSSKAESEDVSF